MATVPPKPLDKLEFYETRLPKWLTSATQVGLTTASVTALETRAEEARSAYAQHLAAQSSARAATSNFYDKIRALHNAPGAGADMIRAIRNKALSTNDPNVYVLAEIPAPATPSPVGPPGAPADFRATLNTADGSLKLSWKCPNPAGATGTIYQVARRIGGAGGGGGTLLPLVALGTRSFVDATIPAGTPSVTYRIVAVRSTAQGPAAEFTVNFGTGAGGQMVASVAAEGGAPKLAA